MDTQIGERKGVLADMNVVPLIDILLVLIIIFMVITPTIPKGLEASIPQPSLDSPSVRPPNVVVVQVVSGGQLKINQDETTWEELGTRLEAIFKERAEKVAFVRGDEDVQFSEIARAIDIMRGSDIEKVGLITARMETSQ